MTSSRPKAAFQNRSSTKQNRLSGNSVCLTIFHGTRRRIHHATFTPALGLCEVFQNFPERAGKSQLAQLEPRTPASIFKPRGRPVGEFNAIDIHRDPVASDRVPHLVERRNREWTGVEKIFRELPTLRLAPGQFNIWEFPEMGVDHAGRTLADEEVS